MLIPNLIANSQRTIFEESKETQMDKSTIKFSDEHMLDLSIEAIKILQLQPMKVNVTIDGKEQQAEKKKNIE